VVLVFRGIGPGRLQGNGPIFSLLHAPCSQLHAFLTGGLFHDGSDRKTGPDFSTEAFHLGEMKTIRLADYRGQWSCCFFIRRFHLCLTDRNGRQLPSSTPPFRRSASKSLTISVDSPATHRDWQERELSKMVPGGAVSHAFRPRGKIGSQYGVYDPDKKLDLRGRFIIDPEGMTQAIEILGIPVGRDVSELLRELRAFRQHRQTGELIPCGWQPGKPTLPEEESAKKIAGRVWEVWKPKKRVLTRWLRKKSTTPQRV